jgi:hypothetical protein
MTAKLICSSNNFLIQNSPIYIKFDCCNTLRYNEDFPICFDGIIEKNTYYNFKICIPYKIKLSKTIISTLCDLSICVEIYDSKTLELCKCFIVKNRVCNHIFNCVEKKVGFTKPICNPIIILKGQLSKENIKLNNKLNVNELCEEIKSSIIIKKCGTFPK